MLHQELARADVALRSEAEMRERFVGILGHDLRQPLSTLLMAISLIDEANAPPAERVLLQRMGRASETMHRMIRDLLDFTRARQGDGIPVIRRDVDLHQTVRHVVEDLAATYPMRVLKLEILRAKAGVFIALQERTQELARLQVRRLLDEQREEFLRREVAAEQRAKAQLAEINDQLAAADRKKTEFLATLAHELRNPLAPIRSCLDVLRETPQAMPPAMVIDVLDRQVTRVTRLVDDMLDMSRIVAGKVELRSELLELGTVVEHALTECRSAFIERRHTLSSQGTGDPIAVRGDALRLVQVVVNLMTNAARYTNPGGAIAVTWGRRGDLAYVRVSDNGIGIQPGVVDSLFEMFAQEGVSRERGGLGLGLPLAKRLIELHCGSIRVSSEGRDRGSMFEITLPTVELAETTDSVPTRRRPEARRDPRRVLVVDDNDDARELLAALLSSRGHEVAVAHDGPSALVLLGERTHDVALVDIGLPGFDGIELVRRARERCPNMATKLVALTGYTQEGDRQRTALAGFDAYLVKPIASIDVLDAIDSLCS